MKLLFNLALIRFRTTTRRNRTPSADKPNMTMREMMTVLSFRKKPGYR